MSKGSDTGFGIQGHAGRIMLRRREFFQRLHVDDGRKTFFGSGLIAAFQCFAQLLRRLHIFAARAQAFGQFVVAQVFLEQIHLH